MAKEGLIVTISMFVLYAYVVSAPGFIGIELPENVISELTIALTSLATAWVVTRGKTASPQIIKSEPLKYEAVIGDDTKTS
jgi:hypothetical protein